MIYITQINICDICGKTDSVTKEGEEYEETSINYPHGWAEVWKDENTCIAYCPECFKKHESELEIDTEFSYGYKWYKYKGSTLS